MTVSVNWLSWTGNAFARARQERRPVLLSITAAWCRWCREMDRTSYADAAVVDTITREFVPVRVDADRRPDLWERYGLGGLPTTAFLTADGEVLGGGTYIPLERMPGVLERVRSALGRASAHQSDPIASPNPTDSRAPSPDELLDVVFSGFDLAHGGFASAPGFPLIAPLELALEIYATTGEPRMRDTVVAALDAMRSGALYDRVQGGFFRCSRTASWQEPHREKLLDVNAGLLRLYVDAARTLDQPTYLDVARGIVRFLQSKLADPAGGWGNSLWFDGNSATVDRTQYASASGAAISAVLRAAEALGDPAVAEFAIASLERILLAGYRPSQGVAHCVDDDGASVRGLLEDQIAMAGAALDAAEAAGSVPYEMMAQELALHAIRTMWDEKDGGLFDRVQAADDVGRLRQPVKSFVLNCEAARLFARLGAGSGDREFRDKAQLTTAAMAPLARDHGPLAAHCLLAMRAAALK
jgi:uncharacterized protein YyaL (SSP411 family)